MSCVLRVAGREFDSRAYARRTTLPVVKVYVRGEPVFKTKPQGRKSQTSGINVDVSSADFEKLKRQIKDAVAFLVRYRRSLNHLWAVAGVESLTLDFAIADRDVLAQFDFFPPDLIRLAGSLGIGIEVSRYRLSGG